MWRLVVLGIVLFIVLFWLGVYKAIDAWAEPSYSQYQLRTIVRQGFPDDPNRAVCIADHESDGDPNHLTADAQNGSMTGIMQVDRYTWDPVLNPRALPIVGRIEWRFMLNPRYNVMVARRIYLYQKRNHRYPWGPWTTASSC